MGKRLSLYNLDSQGSRYGAWVKVRADGRVGTVVNYNGTCQLDTIEVIFHRAKSVEYFDDQDLVYANIFEIIREYLKRRKVQV